MTKEDAIDYLTALWNSDHLSIDEAVALGMAIKALEAKNVLDEIRAKLIEEKECAYADFERYKVEHLGQDWDDVYDSLPQDDFRYGLERCIDIIDKYKAESEDKK